jgi:hypothetical protein
MPASSSYSIIRFLEETIPGTTPVGNPQVYRVTSGGLNQSIETIENMELRSDRGRGDTTLVSGSVSGPLNIDWSHKTHDKFLTALLADGYVEAGTNGIKTITDMAFNTTTHVISSATTLLPVLEKGQYFKVTGAASPLNNGIYRVSASVSPTNASITVDTAVKDVGLTATAASCVISSARVKQGNDVLRSFTVERELSDVTQFFSWSGVYVSSLNLSWADKSALSGNFGFIAKEPEVQGTTTVFPNGTGSAVAATTTPRFNSVTGTTVLIDGITMGDSCVASFTLDIAANLREIRCLGSGLSAAAITPDQFTITGSSSIFFDSATSASLYGKKLTDLPITFSVLVTDADGNGFAVTIPRGKITEATVDVGGLGSDVLMSLNFTASTDSTSGSMILIDRLGSTA